MRLEEAPLGTPHRAWPGVYSTCFALHLLCRTPNPESEAIRTLVVKGHRFVVSQFEESERVDAGEQFDSKQASKRAELGHHDFHLTLKLASVIEATNAIAEIRHRHTDLGNQLADSSEVVDRIACRLKRLAQRSEDEGLLRQAWPWHGVGEPREYQPIPTCHAVLALTHPNVRGTARWLDSYTEVVNYLLGAFESEHVTLVEKVAIARSLLRLECRTDSQLLVEEKRAQLEGELKDVLSDAGNVSWQEALHYGVPALGGTLSHYKPWVWLFPRIDFSECLLLLGDGVASSSPAQTILYSIAADLMLNAQANGGAVVFQRSQAPTLLASLKASDFLRLAQLRLAARKSGDLVLYLHLLLLRVKRLAIAKPLLFVGFFALWLFITFLPYSDAYSTLLATSMKPSWELAVNATRAVLPFWPLWIMSFTLAAALADGPPPRRLRRATVMVVLQALLALLVSVALARLP